MEHIYDIFHTCGEYDCNDMTIAMAHYRHDHPGVIDDDQDKAIMEFIGRHYEELVEAYQEKDRDTFNAVVDICIAQDAEKAE